MIGRTSPLPYLIYAAFSPDGKRLAVKSTTGQIAVVDAVSGKIVCDFRNKKDGEGGPRRWRSGERAWRNKRSRNVDST